MKRYLLDSSFVIDLLNEISDNKPGPAMKWLLRNRGARLSISSVTLAEVLEGAKDVDAVNAYLARYASQGIHRAQAQKVASLQRSAAYRMGENDAWQAAIAEQMNGVIVGHDRAFQRFGARYDDHHRLPTGR
jgi:predicted nucleic acid-binding protein